MEEKVVSFARVPGSPARNTTYSQKFKIRKKLAKRFGWRCWYCGVKLPVNGGSVDHILPKSRNGTDSEANLALACIRCNWAKHDDDLGVFMDWIEWLRSGKSFTPFNMDVGAVEQAIYESKCGIST